MKKRHYFLIAFTSIIGAILVYAPHFNYAFPLHIDEWHHIAEGIRMANYGEYFQVLRDTSAVRFSGTEMGFHFVLFLLSFIFNLVNAYQFFPAIWVIISALTLFFVVYKKTDKNFYIAWLSMIFFISIRSNVNLTGLWFFTPLTFSIPFIFLYTYFFTEGIEKQNKKQLLISLAIILLLIPTHSISVLFAIPAILLYLLINYKNTIKQYKILLWFLIIPIAGILFYKYTLNIPWDGLFLHLFNSLSFPHGWGVLEIHNALTEVYHWAGYILAIIGIIFIITPKNKKYLFYLLWPITTFIMIMIYKLTGISYLSPYQRNLYYFAISMPILSAVGLYSIIHWIKITLNKIIVDKKQTQLLKKFATVSISFKIPKKYAKFFQAIVSGLIIGIIFIIVIISSFANYYNIPPELSTYHVIEERHYQALKFIADLSPTNVMATPFVSAALYPITGHTPVGSVAFYGNRQDVEEFFLNSDCQVKQEILRKHSVSYIISPVLLSCNYNLIFSGDRNYIYKVK